MGNLTERILLTEGWEWVIHREWSFSPEVIETWNALALRYGDAGIFISYGWFDNWWKAFGNTTGELLTFVLIRNGEAKAIFPCCLKTATVNGKKTGYISSLTNDHSYHYDFIIDPEHRQSVVSHFVQLIRKKYPDLQVALEYYPLSSENINAASAALLHKFTPFHKSHEPWAPWTELPDDWMTFNNHLSSRLKNSLKKGRRKAEKNGALHLDLIRQDNHLDEMLSVLFDLEFSSWKGTEGTAIKCEPAVEKFYRLLAHWAMQSDHLMLFILTLGDLPISAYLCLSSGKTVFGIKTGYNQSMAHLSPGNLLFEEIFKFLLSAHGVLFFNFLGPCNSWKMEWVRETCTYGEIKVFPNSLKGWSRYAFEYGWKDYLKRFRIVQNIRLFRNKKDVKNPNSV